MTGGMEIGNHIYIGNENMVQLVMLALNYTTLSQCPHLNSDIQNPRAITNLSQSAILGMVTSTNVSKVSSNLQLTDSSHIIVGPLTAERCLLEKRYPHFTIVDNLLHSDGIVEIAREDEVHIIHIINESFVLVEGLFILLMLLTFLAAVAMWMAEKWGRDSMFSPRLLKGTWDTTWWSFVTMATVGYGDKVPSTPCGKIIAIIWMVISCMFIASMTSIVTGNFANHEPSSKNVATLDATEGCLSWERKLAEGITDNIKGCMSYENCLDMVANGSAHSTFVDINIASRMQNTIKERGLVVTRFYSRPFPYWVLFYTGNHNKQKVENLINCINKMTPPAIEMLHRASRS